jgi:hypothetical protein
MENADVGRFSLRRLAARFFDQSVKEFYNVATTEFVYMLQVTDSSANFDSGMETAC